MRYQLLLCQNQGERSGPGECAVAPTVEPLAGGAAGTVGLQWFWELVELRLGQDEPDTAA
jgi:hypothetical protein